VTRVLLLEPAGPESGAVIETARARGYDVHGVTQADHYARYSPSFRESFAGLLMTDLAEPSRALLNVVAYGKRCAVDAVLTTNEYLTPLAALACDALGLPGNDPARAHAPRDKGAMSAAFAAHGVSTPRTAAATDPEQLRRLVGIREISLPAVVKPAVGAGSAGVSVVLDADDCAAAWREASAVATMYGSCEAGPVIVQDHVVGPEYSIESFTYRGRTTHVCITEKITSLGARRVELGHNLPATLPQPVEQVIHEQVAGAIRATGIRNGASHTEVIIGTDGRCSVIEIGARLAAGHIGFLLSHALGIDPWSALLDIALGRCPDLTPTRHRHAAVGFLSSPRTGRLRGITGLPQVGGEVVAVHLRLGAGDAVEEARTNRSRLGHVIVVGNSRDAARDHLKRLLAGVSFDVEPSPEHRDALRPSSEPTAAPSVRPTRRGAGAGTTAARFDAIYADDRDGRGAFTRVLRIADPTLPAEVEPLSFLCSSLLEHIDSELALRAGDIVADLGCGGAGPGLWLTRKAATDLIGIDFSPLAISRARERAVRFGRRQRTGFAVCDLEALSIGTATVDAAICIDALQYAHNSRGAASEARRILRRGGRLVLTGWHPQQCGDARLPERHRHTDWPAVLREVGYDEITVHIRPEWTAVYVEVYRVALAMGEPGADVGLAALQGEARRRLDTAHLLHRIAITATAGEREADQVRSASTAARSG